MATAATGRFWRCCCCLRCQSSVLDKLERNRNMTPFVAEFIGTALLVTLGNGVVANVVLSRTKGSNSGWIVITAGWGLGVFVGVFCSQAVSGAHLNPAV